MHINVIETLGLILIDKKTKEKHPCIITPGEYQLYRENDWFLLAGFDDRIGAAITFWEEQFAEGVVHPPKSYLYVKEMLSFSLYSCL